MSIELANVSKYFGNYRALDQVSLSIKKGELIALLGPSGCGKTTLLRLLAGLEVPDTGTIHINDQETTYATPAERKVGFVFQHYALFRHMNVFENVAFGLRVQRTKPKISKEAIAKRVHELLALVQMDWAAARMPDQLSGGQRQRVALARALAVNPSVLLLDEPFSALDAKVRQELRRWLRRLHDEIHITSVFVTHDQEEALELADRVVVMNQGKIEQLGTPEEVYDNPVNSFVYNFLGLVNVFHSRSNDPTDGKGQRAFARPHEIGISRTVPEGRDSVEVIIRDTRIYGGRIGLTLERVDGQGMIEAEIDRRESKALHLQRGERVFAILGQLTVFEVQDYQI